MADFQDVISELKKVNVRINISNLKMDRLIAASDPRGAAAAEDKADQQRGQAQQINLLQAISDSLSGSGGAGGVGPMPPEDKKGAGIFAGIGRVIGGLGKGVGAGIGGFIMGIGKAVTMAGPFVIVMAALGAGLAAFGLLVAGAGVVISKFMPDIAEGLRAFDGIDGGALIKVGGGIAALGGGFAVMGLGSAVLGVGNLIGNVADGISGLFGGKGGTEKLIENLEAFSALQLDTENIKRNAEALAAYSIAMTAAGAGQALSAIGNLADTVFSGIGSLFGAVPILDKLKAFGAEAINVDIVENNAKAMAAYAEAMALGAAASGGEAIGSVFNFVTTAFDGLSGILGGEGVLDKMLGNLKKISAASSGINVDNVKNVADAMGSYTIVMAGMSLNTALGAAGSVMNFVGEGFNALTKLFGGDDPLTKALDAMVEMTNKSASIDPEKIKNVANAMGEYTKTTALLAKEANIGADAALGNFVSAGFGALTSLIGGEDPLTKSMNAMVKMSGPEGDSIDKEKIIKVGDAMAAYAIVMDQARETSGGIGDAVGDFVGGAIGALGKLIGADDPLTKAMDGMKQMSDYEPAEINIEKIQNLGKAMGAYGETMAAAAEANPELSSGLGDALGNLATGLIDSLNPFSGDDNPVDKLKEFAAQEISSEELKKIQANADAFKVYSEAISNVGDLNQVFGDDGDAPKLAAFAEQLNDSFKHLNEATGKDKFGNPELAENFRVSGQNLKGFFDAFRGVEGLGSDNFLGSDDIAHFAEDLEAALPGLQKEIPKLAALFGATASAEVSLKSPESMQVNELVANTLIIKAIERNAEGRVAAEGGGNVVSTNINAPSNSSSVVNTGTALRNTEAAAALANFR